jgi:hypothetical protein
MNVADFKIDPNARISIPFKCASYDPSACELVNFLADRVLFCGKETFAIDGASCMSNFGAKVTIPREPSLSRLTKKIVGGEKNPGRVAQKLLDFVTDEIEYDHDEKEWSDCRQVAKRANEVLMTRRATCASKAALYASLLEQVGIDYILAYYPNHLAVFVIGEYPDGHSIVFSGRRWFFAESTCPGFVIGETKLDTADFSPENDWTHIQRPKDKKIPEARKPPLR